MKFPVGSVLQHRKRGTYYRIRDHVILEWNSEPAYSYVGEDGIVWVRTAKEMEDGRFDLVKEENHEEAE